jgi:amino acid transporter
MAAWLIFAVNAIVTSMVAISFGSYAAEMFFGDGVSQLVVKLFAIAVILLLTVVNTGSSSVVERAQSAIVWPLIIVLGGFAVIGIFKIHPALLAPSTYPPTSEILSSVGLTFFAFLGFAIVSFTAGDLEDPRRGLPRAMYIALGITTLLYVAIAIAVFGTLTQEQVTGYGDTAFAEAAKQIIGPAAAPLIVIAALLATSSSVNAGIYPANGLSIALAEKGQFPPVFARRVRNGTVGLLINAGLILILTTIFDLSAIANLGSATALLGFLVVSIAHMRVLDETGANRWIIILGGIVTAATFVYFTATTIIGDWATTAALIIFLVLAVVLDLAWKWRRGPLPQPAT